VEVTVQIASGGGALGGQVTVTSDDAGIVAYDDLSIRGSPGKRTLIFAASDFTSAISTEVDVGPGPPSPSASSASVPDGLAGSTTEITVRLEDEFGTRVPGAADLITVSVDGPNPISNLEVEDRGDGIYGTSYTPTVTGTDEVEVRVDGNPIAGSPYTSLVLAGAADPSTTTAAFGRTGFFGTTLNVVVTTRDAHGNLLGRGGDEVQVRINGGDPLTLPDRDNGTYSATIGVGFGSVSVAILLNGDPIAGSPFRP
jgi:hypothetical protein